MIHLFSYSIPGSVSSLCPSDLLLKLRVYIRLICEKYAEIVRSDDEIWAALQNGNTWFGKAFGQALLASNAFFRGMV